MTDKDVFRFRSNRRLTIRPCLRREKERRRKLHQQISHAFFFASRLFFHLCLDSWTVPTRRPEFSRNCGGSSTRAFIHRSPPPPASLLRTTARLLIWTNCFAGEKKKEEDGGMHSIPRCAFRVRPQYNQQQQQMMMATGARREKRRGETDYVDRVPHLSSHDQVCPQN